jgi:hypothetical protein
MTTSRGLSGIARFTFMPMICRFIYHTYVASDFQMCIDELNLDLQRVHEWAAANGLKLNPMLSRLASRLITLVLF